MYFTRRHFLESTLMTIAASCLAAAGKLSASEADAPGNPNSAGSTNRLGLDLYARLADSERGNLFISPYSIETALSMTLAGARGQTADQMTKVLHLENADQKTHAVLAALTAELNGRGDTGIENIRAFDLVVANALWLQKGFAINGGFQELVKSTYAAGIESLDFKAGGASLEHARQTINDWVASRTHDKIKDLLSEGVLDAQTRLVLTNAIYFKSNWDHKFQKDATTQEPFHLAADRQADVPMMHQSRRFRYVENDAVQAVELPYMMDRLSMLAVLPRKADGLADVEKSLSAQKVDGWVGALQEYDVDLSLPRFKFSSKFALARQLEALGMSDAFSGHADFSGISTSEPLQLQQVIHQAFVEVDENGTEAAAATAVAFGAAAMPRSLKKAVFKADHPFLFLIRDNASGTILFLGRVMEPKQ